MKMIFALKKLFSFGGLLIVINSEECYFIQSRRRQEIIFKSTCGSVHYINRIMSRGRETKSNKIYTLL